MDKLIYKKPTRKYYEDILSLKLKSEELYKNFIAYSGPTTMKNLLEWSKKQKHRILLVDGKLIGFASWGLRENGIAWLSTFNIDQSYKRKGYGTKFLEMIEEEASKERSYLVLEYWPEATWAKKFYLENAYKEDHKVFKSKSTYAKVLVKKIR